MLLGPVLLGLVLAACSVGDNGTEPGASTPQALLDALAEAERAGDTGEVRSLIDPDAPTSFVSAELSRTAGVRELPLSVWRYRIDGDAATGSKVKATFEYALEGADEVPVRRPMEIELVQRGSSWLLGGFADVAGEQTYRGPWDFGRIAVQRAGDRAVVVAHPGWERLSNDVVRLLPAVIDDVAAAVGGDLQRNVAVFLTSNDSEYVALGGTKGVAAATISDDGAAGQRIVMAPEARSKLNREALRVVIRHELVHVATRSRTVPDTPLWVTEGFADFVAFSTSGVVEPQSGGIPEDAAFAGPDANRAYATARTVFAFVDEQCGDRSAVRFYDALAGGAPLAEVTENVCGLDEAGFLQSWREWTLHT